MIQKITMGHHGYFLCWLLEIEVSVSVVIRDVFNHLMDEFHFALRKLSVLDIFSDKVTKNTTEVLVTWI